MRRFEDVIGAIKKDFTKSNATSPKMNIAYNQEEFVDERELDSERSDEEEREKRDPYDVEYEEQAKRMSMFMNSYFENVENIRRKEM